MRCERSLVLTMCVAVALTAISLASVPGAATASTAIGTFNDWSAHQFTGDEGRICFLHSEPQESAGEYTRRGPTYVQVTHRLAESTRNVVSITAGYPYREDSEVTVVIDGRKFSLFTNDDTAWAGDAAADEALVAAMRAGRKMVIEGTSSRGTLTTDTYSLTGFTAAHRAINQACPAP